MSPLETLLVSAIVALSGVIGMLWRVNNAEKKESARLIFALLQRIAVYRSETPPPTASTPDAPQLPEAHKLATKELNGEIEQLLSSYLDSSPPRRVPGRRKD